MWKPDGCHKLLTIIMLSGATNSQQHVSHLLQQTAHFFFVATITLITDATEPTMVAISVANAKPIVIN